jgi:hypothetical protein
VNLRIIVTIVVIAGAVAGCTVRSSGDPLPTRTSESETQEILPPRPTELDLADVDPCTELFTEQQLHELGYDLGYARPPVPGRSAIHGGLDCTYSSTGGAGGVGRDIITLVGISTSEGALAWVTDPRRAPDHRPEVVVVAGYSALVLPHPELPDDCMVVVDTARDQYLAVSAGAGIGKGLDADPYCAEAERVAAMAITTVSASR